MDDMSWDVKCEKCGNSIFSTYMETIDGERYGVHYIGCECTKQSKVEEELRV